jgi:3-oxoacyl-[acyl-carrier-protein] synthase I
MRELVITAANSITPVGLDAPMTAASVRAGIRRLVKYDQYRDAGNNPITVAHITGIENESPEIVEHVKKVARICLEGLLADYDRDGLGRHCSLILGVAARERPGARYDEHCLKTLLRIVGRWAGKLEGHTIARGNASFHYAVEQAARQIEKNPAAVCIIGGIDSLLRESTLNWFESDGRLKSSSYGRHQGLTAAEAVGFLIVEDRERAQKAGKPILARISAWGLAEEPQPRAAGRPGMSTGLSGACLAALDRSLDRDIRAVFGDLNGEESRAREWSIASMRCFGNLQERQRLWKPAASYGDIGAAGGAVMAGIAVQGFVRGWVPSPALIVCSDDHGACGALVLEEVIREERSGEKRG